LIVNKMSMLVHWMLSHDPQEILSLFHHVVVNKSFFGSVNLRVLETICLLVKCFSQDNFSIIYAKLNLILDKND